MKQGKIIITDDNKNVLTALKLLLSNVFEKVILLNTPKLLLENVKEYQPDIVLLDMNFSAGINTGNEGLYWLTEVKKAEPDVQVVLFTAYGDVELAVEALKKGATDFIVKPWDNTKLLATLQSAYALRSSQKEVRKLKEKQSAINEELNREEDVCLGKSKAMKELMKVVEKVAKTDANVFITGENGTGKELIAKKIHAFSKRASESLVTVDMGAVTETLFESELFGHIKGSFTDAKTDRAGKFEVADKGTLFLDEIGNLSYPLQAKLLTALQSRSITRVGSNTPIPVDIRLISATNKDLYAAVDNGEFRQDLLYRINTIHIEVPPLRDRTEDIPELIDFFLERFGKKYGKPDIKIDEKAVKKLQTYQWLGNVRELQHTIEKAVILSEKDVLQPADFYLRESENIYKEILDSSLSLEEMEKKMVAKALKRHNGNISRAAKELNISRPTLMSKIEKYNV